MVKHAVARLQIRARDVCPVALIVVPYESGDGCP